jgi:excinuclease ABC subunit B
MSQPFVIESHFVPMGDQPGAIKGLVESFEKENQHNVLLGVTGSGKTFTIAKTIEHLQRPALLIAPNKTLAAQLFLEMRELFPNNAVHFFISYYDYYQPEAYIPSSDTFIEKDSAINDDIDKMRHSATMSLFERKDVIVVSSVSCIYGLGNPDEYGESIVTVEKSQESSRNTFLRELIDIQYTRNDAMLERGCFRVRGDIVDVQPASEKEHAIRIEFFGDEIERILLIDALSGKKVRELNKVSIYPNSHYVTDSRKMSTIVREILDELGVRLRELKAAGKSAEYERLEMRTMRDIELMEQLGFCPGIENYSRFLTGLPPGHPPPTLLNYFPDNFITILDESHLTVPQLRAMYNGDRSRKTTLVDYGFRLPAALDNRPLQFDEFNKNTNEIIYVSATPAKYELELAKKNIFHQEIRPTGLLDPPITIKPALTQIDDLYGEIKETVERGNRVLVTTLTKRMAEDITTYFFDIGIRIKYLHSDIDSLQRVELLQDLRRGAFDVLVGINLLREGLDLPEVELVAILDADKEGFLRSRSSLMQTVGRAARNASGRVIFYADRTTDSMRACIDETSARRKRQAAYNEKHGITPRTVQKSLRSGIREIYGLTKGKEELFAEKRLELIAKYKIKSLQGLDKLIRKKDKEMKKAAGKLDFEQAASIRDETKALKQILLEGLE